MGIPATPYVPIPQSIGGEYNLISAEAIVDTVGVALVDPTDATIAIVSPTSTFTPESNTVWAADYTNE